MIGLLPIGTVLLSGLLQIVLRGGSRAASPAPNGLRQLAAWLIVAGAGISIAPLFPLVMDLPAVRSTGELGALAGFLLASLAMLLPAWIWTTIVWRKSTIRSCTAFALAVASVNIGIAVLMYRGFLSGDADSQDGIVVQLVPLWQLAVVAGTALMRYSADTVLAQAADNPPGVPDAT